jgi:hypothetical protein
MRFSATIAASLVFSAIAASAHAEDCSREAFATVVGEANIRLSSLNQDNKKSFQEKLQALKTRNGWSDSDYVTQATPYVQDERIAAFDAENKALLARIPQLGDAGPQTTQALAGAAPLPGGAADPRCAMLNDLRSLIGKVVENTQAKWRYMAGKLDGALDKARQAQAAR